MDSYDAFSHRFQVCSTGTASIDTTHTRAHFYLHGLTVFLAWISNHIHYTVWDEITYLFSNINGVALLVWEWICEDWSMLELKLIHVSKWGTRFILIISTKILTWIEIDWAHWIIPGTFYLRPGITWDFVWLRPLRNLRKNKTLITRNKQIKYYVFFFFFFFFFWGGGRVCVWVGGWG